MGASKYEFNPRQFDEDIQQNAVRYETKMDEIRQKINSILASVPARMPETFSLIIEVLREKSVLEVALKR
ncbi:hypothetical protein C7R93_29855 [Brevibacillus fortis]|uniref:Uncharacterized protein n=1 Tax=Brevibacillus fortis TaxID=2126352 RepID=A0A2P7UES3_9BACL|nr:hypothetical protein C7R93_29855 [Brevibacillus fortis]